MKANGGGEGGADRGGEGEGRWDEFLPDFPLLTTACDVIVSV